MTPEQIGKGKSEHAQQAALFCWAAQYPELKWMFAIPNGGTRDRITAGKLKAEGVKAGVADIFLPVGRCDCYGLWIEMKNDKGKPSDKQIDFRKAMIGNHYGHVVCYSWQEASNIIIDYMGWEIAKNN